MSTMPEAKEQGITISVGQSRKTKLWDIKELTWPRLVNKLSRSVAGQETHAEYMAMSRDRQSELKDVGGFVGGAVTEGRRVRGSVTERWLFTGDADHPGDNFMFEWGLWAYAGAIYSTRKHGPTGDRLRLVVPLSRGVDEAEYQAVARWICSQFGMDVWDKSTLEMNRLMYWPSHSCDVEPVFEVAHGNVLDVDWVLGQYKNWRDVTEWPQFPEESEVRLSSSETLGDPRDKPGAIGWFCQQYGIGRVLDEVLPGVYSHVEGDRWTYVGGTTSGGAIVYDDLWLYSHHEKDPCAGRSVNAFDLVRLHKFGSLDAGLDDFDRLEIGSLPSQEAMVKWVEGLRSSVPKARAMELIEAATTSEEVEQACLEIRGLGLSSAHVDIVASHVKAKMKQAFGEVLRINTCREMVEPPRRDVSHLEEGGFDYAKPYYYVASIDKFYNVENGKTRSKTAFNAAHNRQRTLDVDTPAADQVLDGGLVDVVDELMYAPMLGPVFEMDGAQVVNSFRPSSVPEASEEVAWGAVEMVLDHIRLLFSDREELVGRFVQFLAHNVQKPGVKIRHSWLIKGCEGDGKTTIHELMAAVMGRSNTRVVSAATVRSEFNGYAEGAAFASFEEVRIVGQSKHEIYNTIKPLITNNVVEIHKKGRDGFQAMNCTNYLAFTNHVDALPLTETERRFTVVFSPYGDFKEILALRGGDYFDRLYKTIEANAGGLRRWLLEVDISDYDCHGGAILTPEKGGMESAHEGDETQEFYSVIGDRKAVVVKDLRLECELAGLNLNNRQVSRMLLQCGFTKWHKQFFLDNRNVTVYGLGLCPPAEQLREMLNG